MADLIVSFAVSNTRANPSKENPTVPLGMGSTLRSEALSIGAVTTSTLMVQDNENVVYLSAGSDCWVEIGANPAATKLSSTGTKIGSSILLRAGEYQFAVRRGERVSVVAA